MELRVRETPKERRKAARESALAVLNQGQNRLSLTVAALACLTVSFICYFVMSAASWLFYDAAGEGVSFWVWLASEVMLLVLLWLLAMPLWLGMYRMAHRMMHGEPAGAESFFAYVCSASMYGRALGVSWRLLVRWLPTWVGYLAFQLFFDHDIVGVLLVAFMAVTAVLSITFVSGLCGFVTMAAADDGRALGGTAARARELFSGERMCVIRYDLLMSLRLLLSLIPVGVPFLLHTLPLSMLCAAAYTERLAAREPNE